MNSNVERRFYCDEALWPQSSSSRWQRGFLSGTGNWTASLYRRGTQRQIELQENSGWEAKISTAEWESLWKLAPHRLESSVADHRWQGRRWEAHRYSGHLEGLCLARVVFTDPDGARRFEVPRGFGPEVTFDPRFTDRALAETPPPLLPPSRGEVGWSYGVLPVFRAGAVWKFFVISTRRHDRWIFPKGQPEPGKTPEEVALLEAHEEAGLEGSLFGQPVVLPYRRETGVTNLLLFPMRVTRAAEKWLEQSQRERRLVSAEEAQSLGPLLADGTRWLSLLGPSARTPSSSAMLRL